MKDKLCAATRAVRTSKKLSITSGLVSSRENSQDSEGSVSPRARATADEARVDESKTGSSISARDSEAPRKRSEARDTSFTTTGCGVFTPGIYRPLGSVSARVREPNLRRERVCDGLGLWSDGQPNDRLAAVCTYSSSSLAVLHSKSQRLPLPDITRNPTTITQNSCAPTCSTAAGRKLDRQVAQKTRDVQRLERQGRLDDKHGGDGKHNGSRSENTHNLK